MKTLTDEARVMALFRDSARDGTKALHVGEILERLGIEMAQRHIVNDLLDDLTQRGLLSRLSGSRYRLPRVTGLAVKGRFSWNARGFGFVTAEDAQGDVFIPGPAVNGAMHGDRVEAITQRAARGREGIVSTVITRRNPRIPGTLLRRGASFWLEPDDVRVRGPIEVTALEASPVDGDAALVEITRWPDSAGELPCAKLVRVLGRPGLLDVEAQKILLREAVEEVTPDDAEAEALAFGDTIAPDELKDREDLRHVPFITIDPDDARDHDDAVHVARRDDGGFIAWIAIADVSHYVRPGTAIDRMALERGTSIYLPDRAIPMLPRKLSSTLASLLAGHDRLALVVKVGISPTGKVEKTEIHEAVIRCKALITYSNVAWTLGWGEMGKLSDEAERHRGDLSTAAELSAILRAKRMRRGALDLDLPEARIRFAADGRTPVDVVQSREDPGIKRAYGLIEELMLLANEVVATFCVRRELPAVFRVHGGPDAKKLLRFCAVARAHGIEVDPSEAEDPKRLAALMRKVAGTPHAKVLATVLLRSMPQAYYSADNLGHFGLASEAYLHFTSPIRRYPDVVVHRAVRHILRSERVRKDDAAMELIATAAAESSRLERRAMDVERDVTDLYRCVVGKAHLGEVHDGVVTSVTNSGPFVQIEHPFLDILVRLETTPAGPGGWEVDEMGLSMVCTRTGQRFTLGDPCTIEIQDVSLLRRMVYGAFTGTSAEPVARKKRERSATVGRSQREGRSKRSKQSRSRRG